MFILRTLIPLDTNKESYYEALNWNPADANSSAFTNYTPKDVKDNPVIETITLSFNAIVSYIQDFGDTSLKLVLNQSQ